MDEAFYRFKLLVGEEKFNKIKHSSVAVFGLGGVGSAACDALARCGVSNMLLFDFDTVNMTNMNRLFIADGRDVGKRKTLVMKERILSINPEAEIKVYDEFIDGETYDRIIAEDKIDFCIDAIDSINPKIETLRRLAAGNIKFISSMGAGGRINPAMVRFGSLNDVGGCGLASRIRRFLRNSGTDTSSIKVVYSEEHPVKPIPPAADAVSERGRTRGTQSSCMMVPTVFGMMIAHKTIEKLMI